MDAIEQVKAAGGELLTGGKRIERDGYFVEPAIVRAENHWDIVQEETFAPILYVMTFKTLEEAVEMHNDVRQGLSSSLFTTDLRNEEYFLGHLGGRHLGAPGP